MDIDTFFFALFLGLFVSAFEKVVQQTWGVWKRSRRLLNPYLYMIWTEAVVNLIFAIVTFLYLSGVIEPSLGFFIGTVLLWAIQTQLLSQIIANRVALIMTDRRKSTLLKWSLFGLITTVNISVFCIWIPAHMPNAAKTWVTLNEAWERVEKSFFLILDFSLNLYFLHLVRSRLIAGGLTKYWRLWKFNAAIVVVSLSMDVLLLGLLSFPNPYVYVQFAPVAYIVKLHIELTMAVLISKVVKSSGDERPDELYPIKTHPTGRTHQSSFTVTSHHDSMFPGSVKMDTQISGPTLNQSSEDHQGPGIMRTVVTEVRTESGDESSEELVNPKRLTQ